MIDGSLSVFHCGKPIVSHAAAGFLLPSQHLLPRHVASAAWAAAPHLTRRRGGGRRHRFPRRTVASRRVIGQIPIPAPARHVTGGPRRLDQPGGEIGGG